MFVAGSFFYINAKKEGAMDLINMLQRANFGEPWYKIIINDVQCRKSEFSNCCSGVDIDEIEKYGTAIKIAKAFLMEDWYITKANILVCGDVPKLGTLSVSVSVDKNLPFLVSQNRERIKKGYAVEVLIEGLDVSRGEIAACGIPRGIIFGPLK